jgi:hypothetical protein
MAKMTLEGTLTEEELSEFMVSFDLASLGKGGTLTLSCERTTQKDDGGTLICADVRVTITMCDFTQASELLCLVRSLG